MFTLFLLCSVACAMSLLYAGALAWHDHTVTVATIQRLEAWQRTVAHLSMKEDA